MRKLQLAGRPLAVILLLLLSLFASSTGAPVRQNAPITAPIGAYRSLPQHEIEGLDPYAESSPNLAGSEEQSPRVMHLLVITATGTEPAFEAITTFLDRIGIPYTPLVASQQELTQEFLVEAGSAQGNFQGVILVTGNLGYEAAPGSWQSALSDEEWELLTSYEANYGVRQATFYTYPGLRPDSYGLTLAGAVDTSETPVHASLTPEGSEVFVGVQPDATIKIEHAWTYLASPQENITSLLETDDGFTLAVIKRYSDGRENLALTMDHNPYLQHSLLLHYGVFNWITRGLFLGERHVYLSMQIDDIMIPDDIWDIAALSDQTGIEYRMTGHDFITSVNAVQTLQQNPAFASWTMDWGFNGSGARRGEELTEAIRAHQGAFRWISHTWDHMLLDEATLEETRQQLELNHHLAKDLHLTAYDRKALITPEVSGLHNVEAMRGAHDKGVRYVVSDSSRGGEASPTPNTGIWNPVEPRILMVPRRAANIFYNVTAPEELVSEYNHLYRWYWGRDLTYDEILDVESDNYLRYMLQFDINPIMFHQSNLRAYDGTNSLLIDAVQLTASKYSAIMDLPVLSLSLVEIGERMTNRMVRNAAGVTGILFPGSKIELRAAAKVKVPITGAATKNAENYGGQPITWVEVSPGKTKVVNLAQ